jgi:outer membrane protein assembly factor BamB
MSRDAAAGRGEFFSGSRIGRYLLREEVGRGAMAVVFRARDEELDRDVALKIMASAFANDEAFRLRFRRESMAAAKINDPHIIPVFEAGHESGTLFIAMRLVEGGNVQQLVRRDGPLQAGRAMAIISPIAAALDAAHAHALVHRDVKPSNMLLDVGAGRPDHVYLSDFGLAKATLTPGDLTMEGAFLGTPDYAAPEQIEGRTVDGRADQYALAASAFLLLTGKPPFPRADPRAAFYAQTSEQPPALSSRRPDLPHALDGVLARALAKDPPDRFTRCRDFADSMRLALGLTMYHAGAMPATSGQSGRKPPSHAANPGGQAEPITDHAATVIRRSDGNLAEPGEPALDARPAPGPLLLRPEAADARRHYDNPCRHDGRQGARAAAGISLSPAPRPPAPAGNDPGARRGSSITRRAVIIGVAGASAGGLLYAARGLFGSGVPVPKPAWKYPAGTYVDCTPAVAGGVVYVGDDSGRVHALHAAHGKALWVERTAPGEDPVFTRPAVAGDAVYAGSSSRQGICALDTADGSIRCRYHWGGDVRSGITVAGGIAYYGSTDGSVYAIDTATGKRHWSHPTGGPVQSTPAVAGGIVYFGSADYSVYALHAATGQRLWKRATEGFINSSPAVAGGVVYIGSGDSLVYALHTARGGIIWTHATGGQIQFSDPVIAGGTVYIGSTDGKVYALDAASGRRRWARRLGGQIIGSPAVSAGTVYIGSTDRKFYALDAATGDIQWAYPTQGAIQRGPAVAGGMVYIGSEDGHVYAFRTTPAS